MAIGTLALCFNNINVFRGVVKIRRGMNIILEILMDCDLTIFLLHFCLISICDAGLTAKILDQTHSMTDVYGAFFDFSNMLAAKVGLKQVIAIFY